MYIFIFRYSIRTWNPQPGQLMQIVVGRQLKYLEISSHLNPIRSDINSELLRSYINEYLVLKQATANCDDGDIRLSYGR